MTKSEGRIIRTAFRELVGRWASGVGPARPRALKFTTGSGFMISSRKDARETKFFLRMVAKAEEGLKGEARTLWQEARELHLIFSSIWRK